MPSTFLGIEIGARGLAAAQIGQDVTGHNIANSSTPGYSVQRADQTATDPLTPPDSTQGSLGGGQMGTGVEIKSITRAHDQFLDNQVRGGSSAVGLQSAQSDALQQIVDAYGEPSDNGLNAALTKSFQSFNEVSNNPEDLGIRATAIQNADTMTRVFQSVAGRLTSIGAQLTEKSDVDVQSVNSYATQIASLNATIRSSNTAGQQPNDLLDRRGLLLDKLSSLANISILNNSDGTINVAIGSTDLVVGVTANSVTAGGLTARGDLQGGELAGVAQAQMDLQANQTALNNLAAVIVSQVNAIHSAGAGLDGTTGLSVFSATAGNEAATIAVNPVLLGDPAKLAAAAAPAGGGKPPPGDATVATQLANLKGQVMTSGPLTGKTLLGFFQQTVSDAAGQSATAKTAAASDQASLNQLSNQRDSVTGVATDTEMTNMLKYQRAYEASARVVKTMDDMLGTLITGLFSN